LRVCREFHASYAAKEIQLSHVARIRLQTACNAFESHQEIKPAILHGRRESLKGTDSPEEKFHKINLTGSSIHIFLVE
jgi:hypothetical protein